MRHESGGGQNKKLKQKKEIDLICEYVIPFGKIINCCTWQVFTEYSLCLRHGARCSNGPKEAKLQKFVNIFARLVDGLRYQAQGFRVCPREWGTTASV